MPRGRPKGIAKPPGSGRKKGTPNKLTIDAKAFLHGILHSEAYRQSFRERAETGQLGPAMERYMWEVTVGKPKEEPQDVNAQVRVMFGGVYRDDGSDPAVGST